ncbi:rod shape-determining protein [Oceanivirga miroungae]|uniref:Cell shape-determining protein MreB n=1 Tax=Oceanivirga miroungae TaxID=1130046 RepID=A0A6I8M7Y4_9FUSO|nr:rod shape-determining protein [Oceanivirga miroungae]VWL85529.1 cell shape determining protein MreB/Mrl [Oceanivirga miroungae]
MKVFSKFKKIKNSIFNGKKVRHIGIDLGTANTIIYIKEEGIKIDEPSYISRNNKTERVDKIGELAKKIAGKEPKYIDIIRPLKNGVISNYEATLNMLEGFFEEIRDDAITNDSVLVCIPSGVTQVERRSVFNVVLDAGAKEVNLVEEPIAAAIGSGIDIFEPKAHLVVNVGAGTTEISFISSGGDSNSKSIRIAGDHFDQDIVEYVKDEYGIIIGKKTAETLKIKSNLSETDDEKFEIRGIDTITYLPKSVEIKVDVVNKAIIYKINLIIDSIKQALEEIAPEISADIYETGIYLSGGGARIKLLKKRIEEAFNLNVTVVEEPRHAVIKGLSIILDDFNKYTNLIISDHTEY